MKIMTKTLLDIFAWTNQRKRQGKNEKQSSNSLELLPNVKRFAAQTSYQTTAILAGETQKDRPRMDGHGIGTRPLRRGEKKRELCNSQQLIHFALYILPEDPTDFSFPFLFFFFLFPEGIMAAIVTASGIVWHRTN